MPLFCEFAALGWDTRLPDESTILRLRHLLEKHKLAERILATVNELLTHTQRACLDVRELTVTAAVWMVLDVDLENVLPQSISVHAPV